MKETTKDVFATSNMSDNKESSQKLLELCQNFIETKKQLLLTKDGIWLECQKINIINI
jgi:hypothetical protein